MRLVVVSNVCRLPCRSGMAPQFSPARRVDDGLWSYLDSGTGWGGRRLRVDGWPGISIAPEHEGGTTYGAQQSSPARFIAEENMDRFNSALQPDLWPLSIISHVTGTRRKTAGIPERHRFAEAV